MSQVIIYGLKASIQSCRNRISDTIHRCLMETLRIPEGKRFHRFIALEPENFIFPDDRSDAYTIIEIHMFEGRDLNTRRQLIRCLFERFESEIGIHPQDLEITLMESPAHHWGIRGKVGDELQLNYPVRI
jgi:hypothetical protein